MAHYVNKVNTIIDQAEAMPINSVKDGEEALSVLGRCSSMLNTLVTRVPDRGAPVAARYAAVQEKIQS